METLDDILNSVGINIDNPTPEPVQQEAPHGTVLSEEMMAEINEAIDDYLSTNPSEGNETVEEEEENEDETAEDNSNEETASENPVVTEFDWASFEDTPSRVSDEGQEETAEMELIPENPKSLLMKDNTSRFSGAEWFEEVKKKKIIIAGLGGIGSNLAYQIARLSPEHIALYDNDNVDSSNLGGQMFTFNEIGTNKAKAVSRIIDMTSSSRYTAFSGNFTSHTTPSDIMMCGFDNMDARKMFYLAWKRHVGITMDKSKCLFLDGRLTIDTFQIFCMTGEDDYYMKRYEEEFLFGNEEAESVVCSMKQTTYMACMIASYMTNLFVNFVANTCDPMIPYHLPFFTEYNAQTMILNYEQ